MNKLLYKELLLEAILKPKGLIKAQHNLEVDAIGYICSLMDSKTVISIIAHAQEFQFYELENGCRIHLLTTHQDICIELAKETIGSKPVFKYKFVNMVPDKCESRYIQVTQPQTWLCFNFTRVFTEFNENIIDNYMWPEESFNKFCKKQRALTQLQFAQECDLLTAEGLQYMLNSRSSDSVRFGLNQHSALLSLVQLIRYVNLRVSNGVADERMQTVLVLLGLSIYWQNKEITMSLFKHITVD